MYGISSNFPVGKEKHLYNVWYIWHFPGAWVKRRVYVMYVIFGIFWGVKRRVFMMYVIYGSFQMCELREELCINVFHNRHISSG